METCTEAQAFAETFFTHEYDAWVISLTDPGGTAREREKRKALRESQRDLKELTVFLDSGHPGGARAIQAAKENGASTREILDLLKLDPLSKVAREEYPFYDYIRPPRQSAVLTDAQVKEGQTKVATLTPRTITRTEHWKSADGKDVFTFETNALDSTEGGRYRFLAWHDDNDQLKMGARERACPSCTANGATSKACNDCNGTGWVRADMLPDIALTERVEEPS